jgi:hypothetical protein
MKKITIAYWIITGIFAAFMLLTSIPYVTKSPEVVDFISKKLGYPEYFIPFIGWAKIIGSIAIVIPGYPRINEWAYAGLFFDLFAATYSNIVVGGLEAGTLFMLVFFAFFFASYILYHKRLAAASK